MTSMTLAHWSLILSLGLALILALRPHVTPAQSQSQALARPHVHVVRDVEQVTATQVHVTATLQPGNPHPIVQVGMSLGLPTAPQPFSYKFRRDVSTSKYTYDRQKMHLPPPAQTTVKQPPGGVWIDERAVRVHAETHSCPSDGSSLVVVRLRLPPQLGRTTSRVMIDDIPPVETHVEEHIDVNPEDGSLSHVQRRVSTPQFSISRQPPVTSADPLVNVLKYLLPLVYQNELGTGGSRSVPPEVNSYLRGLTDVLEEYLPFDPRTSNIQRQSSDHSMWPRYSSIANNTSCFGPLAQGVPEYQQALFPSEWQSPIITTYPRTSAFNGPRRTQSQPQYPLRSSLRQNSLLNSNRQSQAGMTPSLQHQHAVHHRWERSPSCDRYFLRAKEPTQLQYDFPNGQSQHHSRQYGQINPQWQPLLQILQEEELCQRYRRPPFNYSCSTSPERSSNSEEYHTPLHSQNDDPSPLHHRKHSNIERSEGVNLKEHVLSDQESNYRIDESRTAAFRETQDRKLLQGRSPQDVSSEENPPLASHRTKKKLELSSVSDVLSIECTPTCSKQTKCTHSPNQYSTYVQNQKSQEMDQHIRTFSNEIYKEPNSFPEINPTKDGQTPNETTKSGDGGAQHQERQQRNCLPKQNPEQQQKRQSRPCKACKSTCSHQNL